MNIQAGPGSLEKVFRAAILLLLSELFSIWRQQMWESREIPKSSGFPRFFGIVGSSQLFKR